MVYATYSTGYRPGGNNRRPQAKTWTADTLTNYEVGWKLSSNNHRVRLNGALFHEEWRGAQDAIQGQNGITSIVNAGNARTEGIESDLSWLATDNLNLSISGTFVDAKTTSDFCKPTPLGAVIGNQLNCNVTGMEAAAGTQMPSTPKIKADATARYKFNVGAYESFVQGSAVHESSRTNSLEVPHNLIIGDTPAYTSYDFSIGTAMNKWTLEAYAKNIFDKRGELGRYSECGASFCFRNYRIVPIPPLSFGIKFGQKF